MKFAELKGKTEDQLKDMILAGKKELFNLRFQKSSGELKNPSRFREVRQSIAQAYTAISQLTTPQYKKLTDKKLMKKPAKATAKKAKKEE